MKKNTTILILSFLLISMIIAFIVQYYQMNHQIAKKDLIISILEIIDYHYLDDKEIINISHFPKPLLDRIPNKCRDLPDGLTSLTDFDDIDTIGVIIACHERRPIIQNRIKRIQLMREVNNLYGEKLRYYFHFTPNEWESLSEEDKKKDEIRRNKEKELQKQINNLMQQLKELNKLIEQEDKLID